MSERSPIFRNSVRRNSDEDVRALERAVRSDPGVLPRLVAVAIRTTAYDAAARGMIVAGWEETNRLISAMDLGVPRDSLVLELGRELTRIGWQPDLPLDYDYYRGVDGREVKRHRPGSTISNRYGTRALVRSEPPVRLSGAFGTARRAIGSWRFAPRYGFSGVYRVGTEELNQGCEFFFEIEPQGNNHAAGTMARELVERGGRRLRLVAPRGWFLARWDGSKANTRPQALGGTGEVAGISNLGNALYHYERSLGMHQSRWDPERERTPEAMTRFHEYFMRGSRAGFVPGDAPPERGASPDVVRRWLLDPGRIAAISALFFGDLFVGGLLIPPEDVGYDPLTLGPRS